MIKRMSIIVIVGMFVVGGWLLDVSVAQQAENTPAEQEQNAPAAQQEAQQETQQAEDASTEEGKTTSEGRKTSTATGVTKEPFGTINGETAYLYTLTNSNGIEIQITDYEGIVVSIMAPDEEGNFKNVVLGYETLEEYRHPQNVAYFAGIHHAVDERFHNLIWEAEEFSNEEGVGVILTYDIGQIAQKQRQTAEEKLSNAILEAEQVQKKREMLEEQSEVIEEVRETAEDLAEEASEIGESALESVQDTSELSQEMIEVSQAAEQLRKMAQNVVREAEQEQKAIEEKQEAAEERLEAAEEQQEMAREQAEEAQQEFINQFLVTVKYTLTENNELWIDYSLDTDEETELFVDNQIYFNLAGAGSEEIGQHELFISGTEAGMQPLTDQLVGQGIPVGYSLPRRGYTMTPQPQEGEQQPQPRRVGGGYVQTWENPQERAEPALAGRLLESESGRVLEIRTTAEAVMFNTGIFMGGDLSQAERATQQEEKSETQAEGTATPTQPEETTTPAQPEIAETPILPEAPEIPAQPEMTATPAQQEEIAAQPEMTATSVQQEQQEEAAAQPEGTATPAQQEDMAAQEPTMPPYSRYSGFYVQLQPSADAPEETPETEMTEAEMAEGETTEAGTPEAETTEAGSTMPELGKPYTYTVVYKFFAI